MSWRMQMLRWRPKIQKLRRRIRLSFRYACFLQCFGTVHRATWRASDVQETHAAVLEDCSMRTWPNWSNLRVVDQSAEISSSSLSSSCSNSSLRVLVILLDWFWCVRAQSACFPPRKSLLGVGSWGWKIIFCGQNPQNANFGAGIGISQIFRSGWIVSTN